MRIGFRTLKTALGSGIAIMIAQWLGLNYYVAAGMITILCIQPTKRASLKTAGQRFLTSFIGLIFAGLFFGWLGYHPWVISLILLLVIPICIQLKLTDALLTSFVIIFHIYVIKEFHLNIVANEIGIMLIGIGVAVIINLYMPSLETDLRSYQKRIEEKFKQIFAEFIVYLREGSSEWDGKEITETAELLKEAKLLASKEIENHLSETDDSYYVYFQMREKQFEVIVRLLPIISSLDQTHVYGKIIADFLEQFKEAINPEDMTEHHLQKLEEVKESIVSTSLPKNKKEFEICASLYHFVNEMRRYLIIKRSLMKKKPGKRVFT